MHPRSCGREDEICTTKEWRAVEHRHDASTHPTAREDLTAEVLPEARVPGRHPSGSGSPRRRHLPGPKQATGQPRSDPERVQEPSRRRTTLEWARRKAYEREPRHAGGQTAIDAQDPRPRHRLMPPSPYQAAKIGVIGEDRRPVRGGDWTCCVMEGIVPGSPVSPRHNGQVRPSSRVACRATGRRTSAPASVSPAGRVLAAARRPSRPP